VFPTFEKFRVPSRGLMRGNMMKKGPASEDAGPSCLILEGGSANRRSHGPATIMPVNT